MRRPQYPVFTLLLAFCVAAAVATATAASPDPAYYTTPITALEGITSN